MDITQLQRVIVDALEDVKAHDIRVFSTTHLTGLFDRVVVAAGTSNRQTKALASSVREKVKEAGGEIISTEGEETGEWVLADGGDPARGNRREPRRRRTQGKAESESTGAQNGRQDRKQDRRKDHPQAGCKAGRAGHQSRCPGGCRQTRSQARAGAQDQTG